MRAIIDLPSTPARPMTMSSVTLLRWPLEEGLRQQLEGKRAPRLLIVPVGHEAPTLRDDLEDWVRDPPDPADLVARLAVLSERAERAREQPRLDADGLLWAGRSWVVIPNTQLCIAELLLAHPNELVTTAALTTTYVRNGSSGHRASVRTMVNRVVGRFAQVGLQVHVVRGKGVILELPRP